jgi:hypothetical protein
MFFLEGFFTVRMQCLFFPPVVFSEEGAGPAEANALGKKGGWSGKAWQRASAEA